MTMSAVFSMCPSAMFTHWWFSQGVTTWAQPRSVASTAMATPARIRRMTAPPGDDATAAPLSPAMNAPEAATRVADGGSVVVTGFAVADDDGLPAVAEVAGAAEAVVVD